MCIILLWNMHWDWPNMNLSMPHSSVLSRPSTRVSFTSSSFSQHVVAALTRSGTVESCQNSIAMIVAMFFSETLLCPQRASFFPLPLSPPWPWAPLLRSGLVASNAVGIQPSFSSGRFASLKNFFLGCEIWRRGDEKKRKEKIKLSVRLLQNIRVLA